MNNFKRTSSRYSSRPATRGASPAGTSPSVKKSHRTFLIIGIVVAIIAIVGIAVAVQGGDGAKHHWDWNNLKTENGRLVYYEDGSPASTVGIDVSSLQGEIDWNAVAQDNIDFAMLRCGRRGYTEGGIFADDQFQTNVAGAKNAGIPIGVYFFSSAVNEQEALEEANYVIDQINGAGVMYPVVYDAEPVTDPAGRANNLSSEQLTKNAQVFCKRIEEAGYLPMVYGNQHDLARMDLKHLGYEVWYAEYTAGHPTGNADFIMWQYTNEASVDGIEGPVDMNILLENSWVSPER